MCHSVCFEAGRLTLTQSSQTAMGRSRKWMSGPGDSWTLFVADRPSHIMAFLFGLGIALRQTLPPSAGRTLLSLDRPLSWMSLLASFSLLRGSEAVRKIAAMRTMICALLLISMESHLTVRAGEPVEACEVLHACRRYNGRTITIRGRYMTSRHR